MKKTVLNQTQKPSSGNGALFEQILEWIEEYINAHGIKIGDALPSEDFIVSETGISRTSIREALTRLRALGVIDSRRKRGMRLVRSPALFDLFRLLGSATIPEDMVGHVGGFRSALEMGMGPEIFRRATGEDIAELRRIFDQMCQRADEVEIWMELDLQFHEKLIRITGNIVAIWLSHLFRPFFQHLRSHASSMPPYAREEHRRFVAALENRDPVGFDIALREHHYQKLSHENYKGGTFNFPTPPAG